MYWRVYEFEDDYPRSYEEAKGTNDVLFFETLGECAAHIYAQISEIFSVDKDEITLKHKGEPFHLYDVTYYFEGGFMKLQGYEWEDIDGRATRRKYLLKPLGKKPTVVYKKEDK